MQRLKYSKNSSDAVISQWQNETLKYLSLGRNALVVMFGTLLAYILNQYNIRPFSLTGPVATGLPEIKVPPFEIMVNNATLHFPEIITHLGSSVIALPLISILESIAVAKSFGM